MRFALAFDSISTNGSRKNRWFGAAATIKEADPSSHVFGVIWDIHVDDLENLDRQEKNYDALEVDVEIFCQEGVNASDTVKPQTVKCRTYRMTSGNGTDNLPSPHYKHVIVMGAKQNKLPADYIAFIEAFPDNQVKETPPAYLQVLDMLKATQAQEDNSSETIG